MPPPPSRTVRSATPSAVLHGTVALTLAAACPASAESPHNTASLEVEPPEGKWAFSAAVSGYLVPGDRDYSQPTLTADRDWLHLEGRYNYEGWETGSLWVGYNLGGGHRVEWELTPMLGGVVGRTMGIAPGYRGSLAWWWLELYSEGEWVIDTEDVSGSFFYTWSELTLAPVEWVRFGLVTQRTRAYESERDVQRGVLLGFAFGDASLTANFFNLDRSRPTVVLALAVDF